MSAVCTISICAGGLMGLPLVVAGYRERKILKRPKECRRADGKPYAPEYSRHRKNQSHGNTAGGNAMDWIKRLNQAIVFIEENLDGELDYEDVAGIAGCPSYYFQQMFLYMTDMTLREYKRRPSVDCHRKRNGGICLKGYRFRFYSRGRDSMKILKSPGKRGGGFITILHGNIRYFPISLLRHRGRATRQR